MIISVYFAYCRENQLLLNVCLQSDKDRTYGDSRELTWDASQGASVSHLCRAVANVFQLPEQNLKLAKHVKEKFEWLVLTDASTSAVVSNEQWMKSFFFLLKEAKEFIFLDLIKTFSLSVSVIDN